MITGPSGGVDGLATQLSQLSSERTVQRVIPALGQRIRVSLRVGSGVPLVLCNGIGASLEVLDPLVDQLNPDTTVVRFDVPGIGGSADSPLPYNFPYLAVVLGRVLSAVGLGGEGIDVLGLSWGGALAQQLAFQNPRRCRHLILVSTGIGIGMVPGRPAVLSKLLTPSGFRTTTMPPASPQSSTAAAPAPISRWPSSCATVNCWRARPSDTLSNCSQLQRGAACSRCR